MLMCLKMLVRANSGDPDQNLHSAASDLGLHCLLRPFYHNIYGKIGMATSRVLSSFTFQTPLRINHKGLIRLCYDKV